MSELPSHARPDPRLGLWLRALRETLTPQQFGIATGPRRRAVSLTQIEVARLAGLTPRAYQGVEQGQRVPGPIVLAGIARAIQMSPTQIEHLRRLAHPTDPQPQHTVVKSELEQLLRGYREPAVAYDQTWRVLSHNPAFEQELPSAAKTPNLLIWFFTSPDTKRYFVDWEAEAADLIARLRTVQGYYRDTRAFDRLLRLLMAASPVAARLWRQGVNVAREPACKSYRIRRPDGQLAERTIMQLQPCGRSDPSLRIAMWLAAKSEPAY